MKQSHRCPKCAWNEILHVLHPLAERHGKDSTQIRPAALAYAEQPEEALFGGTFGKQVAIGALEAAVCRRCGYTELYTKDPGSLPIDGHFVRLITS